MAIKATIFKASLQIADMDRNVYGDHALTIARHPSETDERMLIRVLAFVLNVPASNDDGALELAKSLWDVDEPDLWQKDLTGQITHWIDVGQPDEKRLMKASGRAGLVSVLSFSASTAVWWRGIETKITRARNLTVWQIDAAASQALSELAQRTMQLQVTVQDGTLWIADATRTVEITPNKLYPL
jgi:uncharacterized protein YaeQ